MGSSFPPLESGFDQYHASSWDVANLAAPDSFFDGPSSYGGGYPDGTIFERRANPNGGHHLTTTTTLDPALFGSTALSPDASSGMETSESSGYFSSSMDQQDPGCAGSASVSPTATSTVWSGGISAINMAYMAGPPESLPTGIGPPGYSADGHYSGPGDMESFDSAYYQMPTREGSHGAYGSVVPESRESEQSRPGPLARGGNSSKSNSGGKSKSSVIGKDGPPVRPKKENKRKSVHGQGAEPTSPSGTKLRTASRQRPSAAGQSPRPGESSEHQLARTTHNKVEKAYRGRLNEQFELIIAVLPPAEAAGRVSKADAVESTKACLNSLAGHIIDLQEKKRKKDEQKKGKKRSH